MKPPLLILAVLQFFVSFAQKRQELFDYSFRPTNSGAYYYVVTEKEDSIWHRKAYYPSPQSLAMEGWYKDDSCLVEHGLFTWFHSTLYPKSKGHYANGKKQGVWMAGVKTERWSILQRTKTIKESESACIGTRTAWQETP